MPSSLPRWARWDGSLVGRPIPTVSPVVSDGGLPRLFTGLAPTSVVSRLARRSLALRPADSLHRRAAHWSRRLRRLRFLRRRSDSFRPERLSWPGGTCTHWETPPFTAHNGDEARIHRPARSRPTAAVGRAAGRALPSRPAGMRRATSGSQVREFLPVISIGRAVTRPGRWPARGPRRCWG